MAPTLAPNPKQRTLGPSGLALLTFLTAFLLPNHALATPVVSTLAGTGAPGSRDGNTASATFMLPTGIAFNQRGDLVVSDGAAQRIRIISKEGVVRTLAGSAALEKTRLGLAGSYVDGISTKARFSHPSGVTIDGEGNVYVADTYNHCIRKIDRYGLVSTYAGSLEEGAKNGPRLQARFARPEGLSIDRSGNLYVADPGSGLRKVSASGEVTTIDRSTPANNVALAVAVHDDKEGRVIFVAEQFGLFILYSDGSHQRYSGAAATNFDTPQIQSTEASRVIEAHKLLGFPTALTAINNHTVAFADARTNTIRILETIHRTLRVVAGQPIEDGSGDTGAFKDGPASTSLFYSPLGITSDAKGNLFVADGGNRRIREVSGIDYRYATAPARGLFSAPVVSAKTAYRISYLGNSAIWYNTDWDNSIEGYIEKTLNNDRVVAPKTVQVTGIAGNERFGAASEYAQWLATVGSADLVVLNLNVANIISSFGDSQNERLPPADQWAPKLTAQLAVLRKRLADQHVRLIVVTFPPPFLLNLAESAYTGALSDLSRYNKNGLVVQKALNDAVIASETPLIDLDEPLLIYEQRSDRAALFGTDDYHFSKSGRRFVGEAVSKALERLSPWSAEPRQKSGSETPHASCHVHRFFGDHANKVRNTIRTAMNPLANCRHNPSRN